MAEDPQVVSERRARYYARSAGNSEALAELETARLERYIKRVVDTAPPFSQEQRRRLALIFGVELAESAGGVVASNVPDSGDLDATMPGAA